MFVPLHFYNTCSLFGNNKAHNDRIASLSRIKSSNKFKHDGLREELLTKEKPESYDLIKGTVEAGTFAGSIIGLAILAPQISHHLVHPLMEFLHLDKEKQPVKEQLNVKA